MTNPDVGIVTARRVRRWQATGSAAFYLMYQCPAIDTLSGAVSKPGNGVGNRRYPRSALSPNRGMLENVNSLPPKALNPMPLSALGCRATGATILNVWRRRLAADPT